MRMLCVKNFINGEFVSTDNFIDSFNPATGDVWAQIPDSGREEVGAAVLSAKQAFTGWSHTPVGERSKIVNKIADILESRIDEFAELESHDQGKPVWLAKAVDIPRAVHNFRFFASCILHELNRSSVMDDAEAVNYTVKQPVGVAGLISPWNLPLYLLTFKIAPAIITGNTIVAKPSEMTSVTAFKLCEVFNAAGLPPGVINVVFGLGSKAGQAIVTHPDVPIVSFTGGTVTAETLRKSAAPFSKKLSLELGGKNPAVIFSDADLDKCVHTTIRSSFLNQGEICLCTSRLYVHQDIYKDFVDRFTLAASELVVGDPQDVNTFTGALISKEHLAKVKGYVEVARSDGATVLCGDGVKELDLPEKCRNGYFMRPTVITNVTDDSRLMTEEIFGPVACIVPFETEEEVVRRANSVKYGLCATLWTQNVSRLHRIAQRLQVGTVWANCWLVRDLNMPFGGTKESGIGREGAKDSIEFFTEEKTICVKM
ncbi:2-aminomuconic semialdehyde dehydrogenase-like isoform X1 [Haliotis rufescens]|uniref:2-aminomuconic semialdehyde dehydrogenase-like isoform X1 n=1 Tax=Haliotis rufescens TaxID=6454 RepID=UPI00201F0A8E|nr:2-aminomuconic semialdehyde dehydrogenase-like isoform X1 [Haliotis rufescens]